MTCGFGWAHQIGCKVHERVSMTNGRFVVLLDFRVTRLPTRRSGVISRARRVAERSRRSRRGGPDPTPRLNTRRD